LALPSIIEAVKHLALVAVVKDQDDFGNNLNVRFWPIAAISNTEISDC